MTIQLLAVDEVINNVRIADIDRKHNRYLFIWGRGMWERIWLPLHEFNPNNIELKKGMIGRLCQYQGSHYKTYEFIPE